MLPEHPALDPALTPALICEATISVADAELEAAAGADLVRVAASRSRRRLVEAVEPAGRAGVVCHWPGLQGETPGQRRGSFQ